jgi:hypothetical protein
MPKVASSDVAVRRNFSVMDHVSDLLRLCQFYWFSFDKELTQLPVTPDTAMTTALQIMPVNL